MSGETKTALVLDATGGIGGATAEALARHGWKVRALSRGGAPARRKEEWEWVKGDSMDRASIVAAAKGTHSRSCSEPSRLSKLEPAGFADDREHDTSSQGERRTYLTPRDDLQLWPPKLSAHASPRRPVEDVLS